MKHFRLTSLTLLTLLAFAACGCQVLTYRGPAGETFTRSSLGANTSLSFLTVETDTNGLRRVELRGYQNDSNQALGTVTEAAVRAAIQGAK
jgi:hypothetical protein